MSETGFDLAADALKLQEIIDSPRELEAEKVRARHFLRYVAECRRLTDENARVAELYAECMDERDAAEDRIAELEAAQAWVPCSERMPENAIAVLVWEPERLNIFEASWSNGTWWLFGAHGVGLPADRVTHWRPLPAPPQGGRP